MRHVNHACELTWKQVHIDSWTVVRIPRPGFQRASSVDNLLEHGHYHSKNIEANKLIDEEFN